MNGDVLVKFMIAGPGGNSIVLTRAEAERLMRQLALALMTTGQPDAPPEKSEEPLLTVEP